MKLSIVFPAYNEEKRILPILENYYLFFRKKLRNDFEILIIPNNCSDDTTEIVKRFSYNNREVDFFEIKEYSGKGDAVMKGFELAKGNLIGFVDADESTPPKEFFKLYSNIKNNDGIIGSRKIRGAEIIPKRSFPKNLSSFAFSLIIRILFNLKYKDTQNSILGKVKNFSIERASPDEIKITYDNFKKGDAIVFKEFYNKNWVAKDLDNGEKLKIVEVGPGFMAVYPNGNSKGIELYYKKNFVEWFSIFLSLISFAFLLLFWKNKKFKHY